jgi:hypothetical protein
MMSKWRSTLSLALTPYTPYWRRWTSKLIPRFGVKYQPSLTGFALGVHTSNLSASLSLRGAQVTLPEKTINDIIKEMIESADEDPTTNTNQQKAGE